MTVILFVPRGLWLFKHYVLDVVKTSMKISNSSSVRLQRISMHTLFRPVEAELLCRPPSLRELLLNHGRSFDCSIFEKLKTLTALLGLSIIV